MKSYYFNRLDCEQKFIFVITFVFPQFQSVVSHIYIYIYTRKFISPSGIFNLCGTVTRMVTPKGSISTEGETLQVSVLLYRCSICSPMVTRQMSIFGKFQDTERIFIPCPGHVSSRLPPSDKTCKYATAPSTQKT
jgi:hypothetical protein